MNNAPIKPDKLPATLRRYAHRITDFEDDRRNQNGYWVHLAAGWWSPLDETHIIHENTLTDCLRRLSWATPCKCADCKKDLGAQASS
jgi:hypothetical protein